MWEPMNDPFQVWWESHATEFYLSVVLFAVVALAFVLSTGGRRDG